MAAFGISIICDFSTEEKNYFMNRFNNDIDLQITILLKPLMVIYTLFILLYGCTLVGYFHKEKCDILKILF